MITDRQWTAFRLVYTDGLTYEEVAEKMNTTKNAVAHLVGKIRKKYPDCVPSPDKPKVLSYDRLTEDEKANIKERF